MPSTTELPVATKSSSLDVEPLEHDVGEPLVVAVLGARRRSVRSSTPEALGHRPSVVSRGVRARQTVACRSGASDGPPPPPPPAPGHFRRDGAPKNALSDAARGGRRRAAALGARPRRARRLPLRPVRRVAHGQALPRPEPRRLPAAERSRRAAARRSRPRRRCPIGRAPLPVDAPGLLGRRRDLARAVRENRGAGPGWRTPATSTNVAARRVVRVVAAPRAATAPARRTPRCPRNAPPTRRGSWSRRSPRTAPSSPATPCGPSGAGARRRSSPSPSSSAA